VTIAGQRKILFLARRPCITNSLQTSVLLSVKQKTVSFLNTQNNKKKKHLKAQLYFKYKPASPRKAYFIIRPPFFQYNKRLLRQKTGGACLYMPQDGHRQASFESIPPPGAMV
jgi:hypothetical protein